MSSDGDDTDRTMWLAVVASILISIATLLYLYLTWNFNYWRDRGVSGPRPKPFLGTFSSGFTQKEHPVEENNRIYNHYKNEAAFIGGFSFRSPQLFILSSTLVRDILLKFHKHFQANDVSIDVSADPLLARHPFFLQGEDWRKQRAQVTPAFTSNRLKSLLPLMDNVCCNMVDHIEREAKLGPIESKELAAKYTTDVVASCIFGTEGGSFTAEESEIRETSKALLNQTFMFVVITAVQSIAPFVRRFVKLSLIPKRIEDFFVGLMAEAIRTRKASGTRQSDYLDYLIGLQEKKDISVLDMAAHGVTFFIDGFETTSEVLAFALFEIAMNRDVQKRLRQEILDTENQEGSLSFETVVTCSNANASVLLVYTGVN
uniref:Probable cytochrome P450 28a5 n=2 Tax=Culex pipiens TaxID=7175 RepID=A0A8D8FRG5_CULPI